MERLADFFDWINDLLGVSSGRGLAVHPVLESFYTVLFLYALVTGQKYVALALFGLLGGSVIYYYLYPKTEVTLYDLLTFLAMMAVLTILIIYFAFIRE